VSLFTIKSKKLVKSNLVLIPNDYFLIYRGVNLASKSNSKPLKRECAALLESMKVLLYGSLVPFNVFTYLPT